MIGGLSDLGSNTSFKDETRQGKTCLQDIQEQKEDKRESDSSSCTYRMNKISSSQWINGDFNQAKWSS